MNALLDYCSLSEHTMASQSDLELLALAEQDRSNESEPKHTNDATPQRSSQPPSSDLTVASEVEESNEVDHSSVRKVASLEQRYIELLEQRIAVLEEQQDFHRHSGLVSHTLASTSTLPDCYG